MVHVVEIARESRKWSLDWKKFSLNLIKMHLLEVEDEAGNLLCLFKTYVLEDSAKKEVAAYLLDHPLHGHRSSSSECTGLSGVPPTVFIRTKDGFGCLVKFVESDGVTSDVLLKTVPEEIQKYKLRSLWWLNKVEAHEEFTSQMVTYVQALNVDKDINFLTKSGWEVPSIICIRLKLFTAFLKLAVKFQLKPNDIGLLATGRYKKNPSLNLQQMVNASDKGNGDKAFVNSAYAKMEEGLKDYVLKVYRRRFPKK
ncbi:hypothetical protein EUTSA_v10002798mg [Eutrema salsugineum]|uniref:1-phosphatidylinositol 4-kinase n=1 Tax=Eutrema salsugineum TaxID=72664 RepID=V4KHA4_EUTSA|nr:hypothetical protein EUTSA_v10002798mg [Eutrema salsugineum]